MLTEPTTAPMVSPLTEYVLTHLQVVGWPALVWLASKVCFRIGRFFTLLEARILSHESKLTRIADEDVPAIKDGIDDVSANVLELHGAMVAAARRSH